MIALTLILALGLGTMLSLLARGSWPLEVVCHFRPQLIAASALLVFVAAIPGDYELAAVALGLGLINFAVMPGMPVLKPGSVPADAAGLTVVWANVWKKPQALNRALAWAEAQGADLVLIGECPAVDALNPALAPHYPHRIDAAPGDIAAHVTTRVVAFSKRPLRQAKVMPAPAGPSRPFISFATDIGPGQSLQVHAVHPLPPLSEEWLRQRDALIEALASTLHPPFLIAGDFNATPWCPLFARIPGARIGPALMKPTWGTGWPLLGLPIDHFKASPEIIVSNYRVSPFIGSDHRAILARIHFNRPAS